MRRVHFTPSLEELLSVLDRDVARENGRRRERLAYVPEERIRDNWNEDRFILAIPGDGVPNSYGWNTWCTPLGIAWTWCELGRVVVTDVQRTRAPASSRACVSRWPFGWHKRDAGKPEHEQLRAIFNLADVRQGLARHLHWGPLDPAGDSVLTDRLIEAGLPVSPRSGDRDLVRMFDGMEFIGRAKS